MKNPKAYKLIETKQVFIISLIVMTLTILCVYFWGLGKHNTFFENSIISTTVLSIVFFLFITTGLYKGIKLRDNLGRIIDQHKSIDASGVASNIASSGFIDVGEGIGGVVLSIVLWIVIAIVLAAALWFFSNVLVISILASVAMLYWIFFRALKLVFKNSNKSKGQLMESIKWGAAYTILYNFWIYGILMFTVYLKR